EPLGGAALEEGDMNIRRARLNCGVVFLAALLVGLSQSARADETPPPEEPRAAPAAAEAVATKAQSNGALRGITLQIGTGAVGYAFGFDTLIYAAPAWTVSVVYKPTTTIGIELDYTGSSHRLVAGRLLGTDSASSARVTRHVLEVLGSIGFTKT